MLIGDPKDFAIEIYHEPAEEKWAGFGRMCIHAQDLVLGDIHEEHCSLHHSVERIIECADSLTDLWSPLFSDKSDDEIFRLLDSALYKGDLPEFAGAHQFVFMTNTGEHFDGSKSFIYCTPDQTIKIIFRNNDQILRVMSCSASTFQCVSLNLSEWFREQIKIK